MSDTKLDEVKTDATEAWDKTKAEISKLDTEAKTTVKNEWVSIENNWKITAVCAFVTLVIGVILGHVIR